MSQPFADFKMVKSKITMLQVLEHYGLVGSLNRTANQLRGSCPLHKGRGRPNQFSVNLDKNVWNCFGLCKSGGNILDFVSKKENCTIPNAALKLCEWFKLPVSGIEEKPVVEDTGPNEPLKSEMELDTRHHPYFADRALNEETVKEFGLGFCRKGTMAGRIVVPIHNVEGQLVGYAGRYISTPPDKDTPEYVYSNGFNKTREVFNLHRAKVRDPEDDRRRPLVVVKSIFYCLWLWRHGNRAVALMDSSLSAHQEDLITHSAGDFHLPIQFALTTEQAPRSEIIDMGVRLARHGFVRILDAR